MAHRWPVPTTASEFSLWRARNRAVEAHPAPDDQGPFPGIGNQYPLRLTLNLALRVGDNRFCCPMPRPKACGGEARVVWSSRPDADPDLDVRVTPSWHARNMANWLAGEMLGFDFETTGVDRFTDVPVSYALVTVVAGDVVSSSSGLIDPGREIPAGASAVHGISTERARAEGMPLKGAIDMITEVVVGPANGAYRLSG